MPVPALKAQAGLSSKAAPAGPLQDIQGLEDLGIKGTMLAPRGMISGAGEEAE